MNEIEIKTKQDTTNTTLFNVWHYAMLRVSIPKKSSNGISHKKFKTRQFYEFLYELLDDHYFGIETCSVALQSTIQ